MRQSSSVFNDVYSHQHLPKLPVILIRASSSIIQTHHPTGCACVAAKAAPPEGILLLPPRTWRPTAEGLQLTRPGPSGWGCMWGRRLQGMVEEDAWEGSGAWGMG